MEKTELKKRWVNELTNLLQLGTEEPVLTEFIDSIFDAIEAYSRPDKTFEGEIEVVPNDGDILKAWDESRPKQLDKDSLKEMIANELDEWGLAEWEDNGEHKVYEGISKETRYDIAESLADEISSKSTSTPKQLTEEEIENLAYEYIDKVVFVSSDNSVHSDCRLWAFEAGYKQALSIPEVNEGWIAVEDWNKNTSRYDKLWIYVFGAVIIGYYHEEDNLFYSPHGDLFVDVTHVMDYFTPQPPVK